MDRAALQKMLLNSFRQEAEERLQLLADQLANWQAATTEPAQIESLFREVHSLKGAARAVGLSDTEQLCHHWENLLAAARQSPLLLTEKTIELNRQALLLVRALSKAQPISLSHRLQLQKNLDAAATNQQWQLSDLHDRAEIGGKIEVAAESNPAASAANFEQPANIAPDRIRVNNQNLTSLLLLTETVQQLRQETVEHHRQLKQLVRDTELLCKLQHQTSLAQAQLTTAFEQLTVPAKDSISQFSQYLEITGPGLDQLLNNSHRLQRNSARLSAELALLSDNMTTELQSVLLVAGSVLFNGLPAMCQDLASQTGKQIDLTLSDNNLQIDKRIIDELKPVLHHLIRNAIDHGIEPAPQRLAAGKSAKGQLMVSLTQQTADQFELKISDDGQGIQPEQLKNKALALGLFNTEQLNALTAEEALALVFHSGLSTSAMLTEISGRGLGMAIVQDIVERLAGQLSLHSVPLQGLTVSIGLPTSVSTFRALLIRCGERTLALPLFAVESCLRLDSSAVKYTENRATLAVGSRVLAMWHLADILQLPATPLPAAAPQMFVLMKVRGESFALAIDTLLGDQDITVKSLGPQLKKVRCVMGATLLGDGQFIPILDPLTLYQQARTLQSGAPSPAAQKLQQQHLLVVDDSFTSRTLLKSILETAGYAVTTANDGQDGWNRLKQQKFDLLVSDVEMPKLDGFNLTLKVRHDPALAALPVILVTALHSADDRQRGLEVGANAYLVKSGFDQESLLDSIKRLI